jgi:L-idonate 5-dehydrogenase
LATDQVLVEMEYGGVCGSDVAYWRHGVSGTAILSEPLVLGHEVAGHVAQVGSEITGVEVGSKVAIHPATPVGEFEVADEIADRTNLWPQVRYFGSAAFRPNEPGGFSRYRAVRPDQLRILPDGVSTKEGAVAEPFGVALHGLNRAGDVTGRTVLVNGCGRIGVLAVAAAKAKGAARIYAADLSEAALEIAHAMGADDLVHVAEGEALPTDVEVAIEASGVAKVLGGVIAAVRRGGTLVQVGNLPLGEVSAALGNIVTREIDYRGSYRFVDEISEAIELMDGAVDVSPLMTHEFAIDDAPTAFQIAADRSTGSSKVMLRLS